MLTPKINEIRNKLDCGCSSGVDCPHSMHEALASNPSTEKENLLEGNLRKQQRRTAVATAELAVCWGWGGGFSFVLFFETGSFYMAHVGLKIVVFFQVHHCAYITFKNFCACVYPQEFIHTIPMQRPEKSHLPASQVLVLKGAPPPLGCLAFSETGLLCSLKTGLPWSPCCPGTTYVASDVTILLS